MQASAEELDKNRVRAIPVLVEKVRELLFQLKMEHARLAIELVPLPSYNEFGKTSIKWLFAANKGSALLPLKSVASGGEISRLNLCIKSILASSMTMPTLIFDEIDAGVSGDVALKMGNLLADLSKHHQIISITHSPQIAAKAHHHVFVYKDHAGEKTHTGIRILSAEDKIREIAIMLSSDPPSPAALEAARELLQNS
jgi:DNA repair protein RecN (Recombination protein N)